MATRSLGIEPRSHGMVARAPLALTPYLLVARILLCLVFIPVGVQKLKTVEFHGKEAERIQHLLEPSTAEPKITEGKITPTRFLESDDLQGSDVTFKAKGLYRTALAVEDAGWGSPVLFAWIAVLIELLGGILLLIGLLSRLWGLGICVLMGAAFSISTLPILVESPWSLFALPLEEYNRYAAQLGLFGLAAAILVCGPGGISLDRLLFGARLAHMDSSHIEEEVEE